MITGPHIAIAIVVCLLMWMCWWLGIDHEQSRRGGTRQLRHERDELARRLEDALAHIDRDYKRIIPAYLDEDDRVDRQVLAGPRARRNKHGGIDQTRLHLVAGDRRNYL